mmetsp:Transcript_18010/g.32887  ORF Transcript_18010/g.32887 Transcript_18010/m.32887 type:complete len:383 (-) Transcript_18010:16-1164(-)
MAAQVRYCFITEWLDPNSGVLWKHQLFYYPQSKEVEMNDVKNRRVFLKRTIYEQIKEEQLYLGASVNVFGRRLTITEFGDEYTRKKFESKSERTLAMVKPDAFKNLGKIVYAIQQAGFSINNMRVCKLSKEEAEEFYDVHRGKPFYNNLTNFMSSGRICALELVAPDAIRKWRALIGPTDSNQARAEAPETLRAYFGTDKTYNACHGSDAPDTAAYESNFFFGPGRLPGRCDLGRGTTLCVIKPHLVADRAAGLVIDLIQESFSVLAAQLFTLDPAASAEFYEVYKGVLPAGEFNVMVEELISGPCIAIEVADRDGSPCVESFRELVGPSDPELGRVLRPQSLRAKFGVSKIRNGVHCTDLPEDGELEVQYFFSILALSKMQ